MKEFAAYVLSSDGEKIIKDDGFVPLPGRLIEQAKLALGQTLKEFKILQQLVQRPDRVFARDELLNLVWGEGAALEEHNLDVHIHSMRRKIEADPAHPRHIMTARGIGYKLRSEP